ncbi:vacuolar protein sorting-associated protein 41, partial [Lecanoromycetidae sp. Uapishka_2]
MAAEDEDADKEDGIDKEGPSSVSNGKTSRPSVEDEDVSEEDEDEEEPRLKYASLTKHLKPVYRNGDATSTFLVAGDKMVIGTHNGNIHVLSVPSLKPIRVYRAHTASSSALSISPFPPPLAATKLDAVNRVASENRSSPRPSTPKHASESPSARTPKQQPVPLTPSNQIYVGSASIDGHVCIQSLTDPKDVQLRNFGRPVQALGLSPDFKNDRSYLSGGLAGSLVLTSGGRAGTSTNATTTGAAAQASGWLGSIGLGWDEMAGIWKAHVDWIDEAGLESDDGYSTVNGSAEKVQDPPDVQRLKAASKSRRVEKLVVGWSAEEDLSSNQKDIKRGRHRRQNALQPEMRIIDINTKEEVSVADTLHMSRFESLSATDYHLGVLPAMRLSTKASIQKGAFEMIGGGMEAIGGGIWDATMYPARLFTSSASVRSGSPGSSTKASDGNTTGGQSLSQTAEIPNPATLTHGMKIFIHSPYDCVIATKPSLADHLSWLVNRSMYEEAWTLIDRHPEAAYGQSDNSSESVSSTSTPTKAKTQNSFVAAQASLTEFFADDSSQITVGHTGSNSQVEKEKRRIGELWVEQLISAKDWEKAGRICGQVLGTSSRWEHWVWVFAQASKYEEITPYIPTTQMHPPLPSVVYELMLGHYVAQDRLRLKELLDLWPPELFDPGTIIEAIEAKLTTQEIREDSVEGGETGRDWRILLSGLATLYLANGQPRKALSCYIRLQDADATMSLIAEYHLVDAVSDDIPGFILLRVTKTQQQSAPLMELAAQTLEPIRLLVSEALRGIVPPDVVLTQLQRKYSMPNPYLFFYFRALWHGDTTTTDAPARATPKAATEERLLAVEGKTLVSDYADTAVELFAEYDRPLLMTFLKSSQSYTLEYASRICEQRNYMPELVYLLSKEGRTAQALRLIIDNLNDVSQAIAFAKEQNDASLWDDLLDYSMNKPRFIRGLLEEVGTSINPLKLVKRIPTGLEIEGLREGLGRMLREYEVQESISMGVARVLRGEVNQAMLERGREQRAGVRFDVVALSGPIENGKPKEVKAGYCTGCGEALREHDKTLLIGFPCTHIFHLPCLLKYEKEDSELPEVLDSFNRDGDETDDVGYDRSIGPKVDHAALLRTVVGGGCPLPIHHIDEGG